MCGCCEGKEAKIVCDGIEIATISHTENGIKIEHTREGREICKGMFKNCCK
jgi:hypothetical protein